MAEEITGPYNTKIPGYSDSADIQEALKLFLYGTTTVPANKSQVTGPSIANTLKGIEEDIAYLETLGVGSIYSDSEPTTPVNGYIWVKPSSAISHSEGYAISYYETSAPSNPVRGMLWVDSDSSPLKLYVYSGTEWKAIGE